MNLPIGANLRKLRSEKNISQEKLAEAIGVSVQAVSKWENGLSYPDIENLPTIAEYFGVTLDYLITGKTAVNGSLPSEKCAELPDDDILRIVQARGRTILTKDNYERDKVIELKMPNVNVQPRLEVKITGNCHIDGDINGSVSCDNGVNCGNVGGPVSCGDGVICGNVGGAVSCGDGVICGNVGGAVSCGDGVNCGNVAGSVDAGDDVHCGDITGTVSSGGNIDCGVIMGGVKKCEGNITCREISGAVSCSGEIKYTK
ncbi:MAG: helix-turn-helix domain-containing protein [Huintestinicola sp.]